MNKKMVLMAVLLVNMVVAIFGTDFEERITEKKWYRDYFNEVIYGQDRNLLLEYQPRIEKKIHYYDDAYDDMIFWFDDPSRYRNEITWNKLDDSEYGFYISIGGWGNSYKAYFTNKELLTKVILSIKTDSINDQIIWVQHVLIPIYQLSDENCKKLIKSYVTDSDLNNESAEPELRLDFYIMKLLFVATKIEKSNTNIIPEIKSILESYSPNIFSSKFIILQNMVNAVCKSEKDFDEFKSYLDDFIKQRRKLLPFENTKEDK